MASGKFQSGLVLEIMRMRRTSDNLLRVDFRIFNPTADTIDPRLNGFRFWNNLYYVEEGGKYKASVAKAGGDFFASTVSSPKLGPQQHTEYWVKFPLPHPATKRISFYFDEVEPIEDVPLMSGNSSAKQ